MSSFDKKIKKEKQDFLNSVSDMINYCSNEEIANTFYTAALPSMPNGEYKKKLLIKILEDFRKKDEPVVITFWQKEIDFIKAISDKTMRRLYYGLMIEKKIHPHPSGFIEFQRKKVIKHAFDEGTKEKIIMDIFPKFVEEFNIEMRVVGSKNPISCFCIPDIEDVDEPILEFEENKSLEIFKEVFL